MGKRGFFIYGFAKPKGDRGFAVSDAAAARLPVKRALDIAENWFQVSEFVGLTPGEDDAHGMLDRLNAATVAELSALGLGRFDVAATLSQELASGWNRFAELYPLLVKRNPRLELRDLMEDISERRESASWPEEWEWAIERWVADGAPAHAEPYPVDADIRARLLELHPKLAGWLYYDHAKHMVVFAETDEFLQVKIRFDTERERRISEQRVRIEEARPG